MTLFGVLKKCTDWLLWELEVLKAAAVLDLLFILFLTKLAFIMKTEYNPRSRWPVCKIHLSVFITDGQLWPVIEPVCMQ